VSRIRLDQALEQRGLLPSRARARDAVLRGTVTVNGIVASKPNQPVGPDDVLALDDPAAGYVSRAALKLQAGLAVGGIDPGGKTCLDLGASTGGFTQVLLEHGARKVYAVDVGHGQLHPSIAADARVVAMEGTNGRDLTAEVIGEAIDLLVCDISFVSVTKVLEAPLSLCRQGAEAVILIKPQFEVGREAVGKGGIVSDEGAIASAIEAVLRFMAALGWATVARVPSPISGGDGNRETVAVFRREGRG
jgi:23S rRNA (cytidine1920-2'-O)/16S rRNA (cytidine1409-2'-O)-methyltransferase